MSNISVHNRAHAKGLFSGGKCNCSSARVSALSIRDSFVRRVKRKNKIQCNQKMHLPNFHVCMKPGKCI